MPSSRLSVCMWVCVYGSQTGPICSSIHTKDCVCVCSSSWAVVREIVKAEGGRGLMQGLTSTWLREVPGYFFFFGGYETCRTLLTPAGGRKEDLGDLFSPLF